jgi:hypothetical protein
MTRAKLIAGLRRIGLVKPPVVVEVPRERALVKLAIKGARLVGKAYGYRSPLLWVFAAVQLLVSHGIRKAEAQRVATPVTTPRRDERGYVKVRKGAFPFPRGLYEYVVCKRSLADPVVENLMHVLPKTDRTTFVHEFVPLADREDLSHVDRDRSARILKSFAREHGYNSSALPIVSRRLSYADICHQKMVVAAFEFKGYTRSKKWVAEYANLRGIDRDSLTRA